MTDEVMAENAGDLDFSLPEDQIDEQPEEQIDDEAGSPPQDEVTEQQDGQEQKEPEPQESSVIREMRKQLREQQRKLKELESTRQESQPEVKDPGEMPDIEAFDYDTEAYRAAMKQWHTDKLAFDRAQEGRQAAQQQVAQQYKQAVAVFKENGEKIAGFQDAVEEVADVLSMDQQNALLLKAPAEAHRIVMALSKNPARLAKLAAIRDPVDLGIELAELKRLAQSAPRPKSSVKPERNLKAVSASGGGSLDALLKKAQQTGDYTAYFDAKRNAASQRK